MTASSTMMDKERNWVLLYKFDDGQPSDFLELRVQEETVSSCTGRVKTWGAFKDLSFDDVETANAAFDMVLLFQIPDSEYIDSTVKRLNSRRTYERYLTWWKSWN